MKRIALTLSLVLMVLAGALAQSGNAGGNCYEEYWSLFRQRGGKKVTDGEQKIVVAMKKDNVGRCFLGKVTVKNGEFTLPILIEKSDGTFEEFKPEISPAFANIPLEQRRRIEDAMTITFTTTDGETIKGFFIDFLADKPKANKAAPSAKTLY